MKFLLDEHIPVSVKDFLKKHHYNAKIITSKLKGLSDKEVFDLAFKEKRCIITKDSDFEEFMKYEHYGIIRISGIFCDFENTLLKIISKYKIEDLIDVYLFIRKDSYDYITKKYSNKGKFKHFYKRKIKIL